jgi:glycosyltransferase AglD
LRLRGALLGAGNIALRGHAPQWAGDERLRSEAAIVAVADLSPANREAARAIFPEARLYASAEELLAEETLDFCDICTPPFTHRPLVETAAARGLSIVCEKPLAARIEDAQAIACAVRSARVVFQPCHQYHFSPQWQAVRRLLPRIGRVHLAEYHVQRLAANAGNPHWTPLWRTDRGLAGGGILFDHGAHIFYQLRAALGEPRTVSARVRTLLHHAYDVEDTALVTLDYGDRLAQVSLTWAARRREIRFRFVGDCGEIVGDEERVRLCADSSEEIGFGAGMSGNSSHSEWYAPLLHEFVARARRREFADEPLEEAVYVTRLVALAYASSEQGRALALDGSAARDPSPVAQPRALAASDPMRDGDKVGAVTTQEQQGPRGRAWLIRGPALLALAGLLAWTFHDVRWGELARALSEARMGWIALAAAVNIGVLGFQAARWLALVKPVSRVASLAHAFRAMLVGFAVSLVVPARAGELARAHYFGLETGLSRSAIIGSIVLDALVNAACLLAGLALLPLFIGVPGWLRSGGWIALAVFLVGASAVALLRPAAVGPDEDAGAVPATRPKGLLDRVRHGFSGARSPRALGLSFGASAVAWGLEIGVAEFSLRAVGLHLPLAAVFLVLLAVNVALVFPIAPPGNAGTLELGATLPLLGLGVPKEQALAFALSYHLLQVVPIALLGTAFAARLGLARSFAFRPRRHSTP